MSHPTTVTWRWPAGRPASQSFQTRMAAVRFAITLALTEQATKIRMQRS